MPKFTALHRSKSRVLLLVDECVFNLYIQCLLNQYIYIYTYIILCAFLSSQILCVTLLFFWVFFSLPCVLVHSLLRNLEQFGNLSNAVAASKITISSVSQLFVFYVSGIAYEIDNKPVFKTKKRLSLFLFRPTLESQRTNWKLPKKNF